MRTLQRRTILRGMAGGGAISVGLPLLDCFLNTNGTALASGAALPPVFGTWFQHLGLNPGMWEPKTVGPNYENNIQLKVLDPFRKRINIFSGMKYFLEGRPLETHVTGMQIATTGAIPVGTTGGPSLDSQIADQIGTRTRFRSLEVSLSGSRETTSRRSGTAPNPAEASPAKLYQRIFGPEFKDPNAAEFKPDPLVLARQGVLSYVSEHRKHVMAQLGASDRARLDEYFTSLRQVEQQLAIELEKPAPLEACRVPGTPAEATPGSVLTDAEVNNRLFAGLLAYAVACGQTRVFNVVVGSMNLRKPASALNWHMATHEEAVDEKLGYQREVFAFNSWANKSFAEFLTTMESVKEGAGSVLDRMLILWQTDHSDARTHSMEKVPVMTVGSGGGRIKTGIHVTAPGDPVTRVGLTVQQALGVPMKHWGELGNGTSKTITEIMA
ncbi:MAG: DUF1552 domain-containing protein [Vicinamibacterales bacterium]